MNGRCFLVPLTLLALPAFGQGDLEESVRKLAESLVQDLRGREVKKLAALDFVDIRGYRSALDPFLAEELLTQVMVTARGEFTFVERRQLDRIISEQKLTSSGFFDETTLAHVGKLLGVDAVLTGTISDLGLTIKINARAIAVATGVVFSAAATTVKKEGSVAELLRQNVGGSRDANLATPTGNSGAHLGPQVQASDVFFENRLVRITISGASLSQDKRNVALSMIVENLASSDLGLALPAGPYAGQCGMTLSDEQGHLFRVDGSDLGGIPCLYENLANSKKPESYAIFVPRSRSTIVAKFSSRSRQETIGRLLAVGIEFLMLSGQTISRFSAGISNIQAR